jgi:hypothetical protein
MSTIARRKKKPRIAQKKLYFYSRINNSLPIWIFLRRIKEDPFCIFTGPEMKKAIEILHASCSSESSTKRAKEILQEAGLSAFIPKEARKRRSNTPQMRYWKNHRDELVEAINAIKSEIKPLLKRYYKMHSEGLEKKREAIRRVFEYLIQKYGVPSLFVENYYRGKNYSKTLSLPDEILKRLTEGERSSNVTNLAVSFFAHMEGVSFSALKKLYFS